MKWKSRRTRASATRSLTKQETDGNGGGRGKPPPAFSVGQRGRKEREDFAPPQEHHARQQHEQHRDQAVALQTLQGLAHRGARDAEPLGNVARGKAVAGQQAKGKDIVAQAVIGHL
ncbi:hypothetical protein CS8_068440 [Cupriavidus sp. 8B]